MTSKKATFDHTGKFEPINSIPLVLSYELSQEESDAPKRYIQFIEAVGGLDPWNVKLTPMTWSEDHLVEHYLDSMTGALELGLLSRTEWPRQLFKTDEDLDAFIEALENHNERLCDRHHRMLECLTSGQAMATTAQASEALRDAAQSLSHA